MSKIKYVVTDELWSRIVPMIPERKNTHPRGGGRKPKDDRQVFEAILFVLRFGCQWEALNFTGLCPSSTVHDRFLKWRSEGFFHRLRDAGVLEDPALKGIDWEWLHERPVARTATRRRVRVNSNRPAWRDRQNREISRGA